MNTYSKTPYFGMALSCCLFSLSFLFALSVLGQEYVPPSERTIGKERVPADEFLNRTRVTTLPTMSKAQIDAMLAEESKKITDIGLSDIEKLRKAIAEGADVNNIYLDGMPILEAAARSKGNHIEFVNLLLESGANPNKGRPLWWAEQYSQKPELAKLLVKYGAKVNMYHAIGSGYTEKVAELLRAGADPNALIGPRGQKHWNAETKEYVDGPVDPRFIRTPLSYAESERRKEIAQLLVDAGATMTLAHAVSYRYSDRVIEMLKTGADPNEGSPLAIAVTAGDTDLAALLLKAGAKIIDDNLIQAVQSSHASIVALLLRAGAAVDFEIPKGRIQKRVVFKFNPGLLGISEVPSSEIEQDAFSITNSEGLLLIHFAAVQGNAEIVSRLLNTGLNVNAITKKGYTPLHIATLMGHVDVVKVLLDADADTRIEVVYMDNNYSASELAKLKNHNEVFELIEEHGSITYYIVKTFKELFSTSK